jgi:hypothetical protein
MRPTWRALLPDAVGAVQLLPRGGVSISGRRRPWTVVEVKDSHGQIKIPGILITNEPLNTGKIGGWLRLSAMNLGNGNG